MPLRLHKINITHFRSYDALRLDLGGAQTIVLSGPNGAGKTNILEAVSLLVPGRGLRGADLLDMKSRDAAPEDLWGVAAEVETAAGAQMRIGTGLDRDAKRRVIRIDGRDARTQNELSDHISAVWLTPQMDRLFIDGPSARRKFVDRLVFAYEPEHVTRINKYDRLLRERMKLMEQPLPDPVWLDRLEAEIAALAVAAAASRRLMIEKLVFHAQALKKRQLQFPHPVIRMLGDVEGDLETLTALDAEERLKNRLKINRTLDAASGKSQSGIHRSDFSVLHEAKDIPAAQASTGEQKSLLTAIILAHAQMMMAEKGHTPVLLLDEVAAHLDDARRNQLFSFLRELNGQIFLTGTEESVFSSIADHALFFSVSPDGVRKKLKAVA